MSPLIAVSDKGTKQIGSRLSLRTVQFKLCVSSPLVNPSSTV